VAQTFTLDEFREIATGSLGVPEDEFVDDATRELYDIGLDSLAVAELFNEVQRRYGVEVPDDAAGGMRSIGDVLDYVNRLLAARVTPT
jgi:acyl carrier protein